MINTILTKIFGSQHEREVKKMLPVVAAINEMEPQIKRSLGRRAARPRPPSSGAQLADGATARRHPVPAFAVAREAARRVGQHAALRRPAHGRHRAPPRAIAEMKTGEGKTLVATLPVYLNALAGKGVHVVTVNDYLARRDADWMGQIYRFLGLTVGVIQHDMPDADRKRGLRLRRHLRHQQRVRLRLPARQHEVRPRVDGPARAPLRHRRRGRLDPDRRGAHAADHLRPLRGVDRQVLPDRPHHPPPDQGRGDRRGGRQEEHHRRLRGRREGAPGGAHRGGGREGREAARHRQPLRPRQHGDPPRGQPGAARPRALQARRRLRGQGRQGRHRRRVHRPHDAGPPLVRRPAPGGRGQGGRQDRAREPDARHDHLPELLPDVREARRHDRHRRHRGRGVRQDLQARRHGHPDQPRRWSATTAATWSTAPAREVRTPSSTRSASAQQKGQPVLVGTVSIEKSEMLSKLLNRPPQGAARRAQRQVPRARGRDRRPGRPQGGGHHRHQHGRPRHRHPPRRQPRGLAAHRGRSGDRARGVPRRRSSATSETCAARARGGARRSAACTSSAPSATSRAASTTSCAAAPAARATPAPPASTSRSKTT